VCRAFVGKVVKIEKDKLTLDYNGQKTEVRSNLQDIKIGDNVMFSLDIAMEKVDEEEAKIIRGELE
jgi:hydrogenase maturation factor